MQWKQKGLWKGEENTDAKLSDVSNSSQHPPQPQRAFQEADETIIHLFYGEKKIQQPKKKPKTNPRTAE